MKQVIRRVAALVIGLGLGAVALAGLETVTHISDLNASWPLGSDLASTSDDHIRNIKTALKTDFPNVNGAVNPTPAQFNQLTSNTFTSAVTGNSFIPSSSTIPTNGIYLPAANTLGFSSNSTKWGSVNSTGNWVLVAPSSGTALTVTGTGTTTDVASFTGANNSGPLLTFDSGGATGSYIRYRANSADVGYLGSGNRVFSAGVADFAVTAVGANNLLLGTNGTQRMGISGTGNITTAAPSSGTAFTLSALSNARALDISDGTQTFDISTDSSHNYYVGPTGAVSFNLQTGGLGTTRLSIGSVGNVTVNAPSSGVTMALSSVSGTGTALTTDGVDATAATGTFTATMTGGSTSPTCTARWTRVGNLVMLEICSATATSNSTSFTYTGLPSAVQPTVTQHVPAASSAYEDNSAAQPSTVEVVLTASSGTITFWHNGASTGWTNGGVKGVLSINTISYLLN
jgi:hypothetical protein